MTTFEQPFPHPTSHYCLSQSVSIHTDPRTSYDFMHHFTLHNRNYPQEESQPPLPTNLVPPTLPTYHLPRSSLQSQPALFQMS